jgi:hypothetical protein
VSLEIASLALILFAVIIIVLGVVKVHEYPHKVALARNHPQAQAILVTSLLGLLVFPLWMAALVWAYSGVIGRPWPPEPAPETPPAAESPAETDDATPSTEA